MAKKKTAKPPAPPAIPPLRWDWPKQQLLTEDGQEGDCWRCCVAAILQRPAAEVPHFLADVVRDGGSLEAHTQLWLNNQGYWLIQGRGAYALIVPRWGGDKGGNFPQPPIIACGPTVRSRKPGQHHAVVMQNSRLVYDPHPWQCGLLATTEEYMIVPAYWKNK
jgi:hypothetical protein